MKPLEEQQIKDELNALSDWVLKDDKIMKTFQFDNFRKAMAFITEIAFEAEEMAHHPELFNVYKTVEISLSTHDAGNKVTEKDIALAKRIEALLS